MAIAIHRGDQSPGYLILRNLRDIDQKKQMWAAAHQNNAGDAPSAADLAPYFASRQFPPSVAGETYRINPLGEPPTATPPAGLNMGATTLTIPEQ